MLFSNFEEPLNTEHYCKNPIIHPSPAFKLIILYSRVMFNSETT